MARTVGVYPGLRVPRFPTLPVERGHAVDRNGERITTRGVRAFGVALEGIDAAGIAAGKGITVAVNGEENLLYGEGLNKGDELTAGADGKWYRAVATEVVSAYCTHTGPTGQLGRGKLLDSGYVKP